MSLKKFLEEERLQKKKAYYQENKKQWQEYYKKNKEKIIERAKNDYIENRIEKIEYRKNQNDLKRFGGKRKLILERDSEQCRLCNISNEQHLRTFRRELNIHHVDEVEDNWDMENLISLCVSCHAKVHSSKEDILNEYL